MSNQLRILGAEDIRRALDGQEQLVMDEIRAAYETHQLGQTSLPHSSFLRFPQEPRNRIISLPAYLGGPFEVAGLKWIASFPGNHAQNLDRASACMILNSMETGRPYAILEGSIISARRTAASAAVAARYLHSNPRPEELALVGCGPINFEIAKFLRVVFPSLQRFIVHDTNPERAAAFGKRCREELGVKAVDLYNDPKQVLARVPLVSFATNTGTPHIETLQSCPEGTTILGISLRDLSAQAVLECDNIVDDVDHVVREQTSLHLAEQKTGNRDFIRATLADVTLGQKQGRLDSPRPVLFSPFGLGILDLALGKFVTSRSEGQIVPNFLPEAWAAAQ